MRGLGIRAYNIIFHTHTVSGIVISFVLFIIFFAGALSLYKQEIYQWENPQARIEVIPTIDYERLLSRMDSIYPGAKESHEIRVIQPTSSKPIYTIYAPIEKDSGIQFLTFMYNPHSDALTEITHGEWSTTGETLYRLHFLDQIPLYIGRYLAGVVSLFFAFAVITGLLIHWKNIVSKFYAFSFKRITKQFWTNAHTVFGIIGLPFQLMYAITGAFYMLILLVLAPTVLVLFGGDDHKLIEKLFPMEQFHEHEHAEAHKQEHMAHMSIAEGLQRIQRDHPKYNIPYLDIVNLGQKNAVLGAELTAKNQFNSSGIVVLDLHTGGYKMNIQPGTKDYTQSILQGINQVHFGSFGGWLSKALYFILSVFTCFVIISGVLMWKEARNKPTYTDGQRKFHHRVTKLYLAICFSLFPTTAFLFLAEQLFPQTTGRVDIINSLFFGCWLVLASMAYLLSSEKKIAQFFLWTGGVLAILVPIANGFATGDWFWGTASSLPYVFMTDIVWLITGFIALSLAFSVFIKNRQRALT